jgi:hypothetical protein
VAVSVVNSRLKRVTWREWLGLGAGLLAAASLFLTWTTLSASAPDVQDGLRSLPTNEVLRSAWKSDFLSWFPPILLLVTGVAVVLFGQVGKARESGLPQLWLIASSVVVLMTAFSWYGIDLQFGSEERALFTAGGIRIDPGIGRYIALLAAFLGLFAASADGRAPPRRRDYEP